METASARRAMAGAGEAMARPPRNRVERYEMRMLAIGLDLMEGRWKSSKLYYEDEVKSCWMPQNIEIALRFIQPAAWFYKPHIFLSLIFHPLQWPKPTISSCVVNAIVVMVLSWGGRPLLRSSCLFR
jgi:hypothetical protein